MRLISILSIDRFLPNKETSFYGINFDFSFISALVPVPTEGDDQHRSCSSSLISGFYTCYYYCSYTRDFSCYSDKMYFVCLRHYLMNTTRAGDDDRLSCDIRVLVGLRSDKMEHGGWHGYRNRRVTCGGTLDDGELRKALHN